jgi:hypothetical protein
MNIVVENNKDFKVRQESGKIVKTNISNYHRTCTFDRLGSRFQITVTSVSDTEYVVAISNFFFSIQTPYPTDIAYKLIERDVMSRADAESAEMAIEYLLSVE